MHGSCKLRHLHCEVSFVALGISNCSARNCWIGRADGSDSGSKKNGSAAPAAHESNDEGEDFAEDEEEEAEAPEEELDDVVEPCQDAKRYCRGRGK